MRPELRERIERYRSERQDEAAQKRKKVARVLVIGNMAVLAAMLFFVRKPLQVKDFVSVVEYNKINYRLTAVQVHETKKVLLSLALKSASDARVREIYGDHVATVTIRQNDVVLHGSRFGSDVQRLDFAPGEVKNFRDSVDGSVFTEFAARYPDAITPRRKSYLFGDPQNIRFRIGITVNTAIPVSTEIDFLYEID